MPKVSVIIPNYNHAPYLKQRIDSVLTQTFQDLEVIILDDFSKDNSRDIIKEYESNPRVQIAFNEKNSGCLFKQWNKGLKMATGQYVWIAESDDYAAPTFLETMVGCLDADSKIGVAYSDSFRVFKGEVKYARELWYGEKASSFDRDFKMNGREFIAQRMLLKNSIPNASAALFRRSLSEQIGGADEAYLVCSDALFWIKLLELSDVAYFATPLNYYRYHEQTARHANVTNGIILEESCRISLHVLENFPVPPADSKALREHLSAEYIEMMVAHHSSILPERKRNLKKLISRLDPDAVRRLWFRTSGLQWLWLGCRRRILTVWSKLFPGQATGLF